MENLSLVDMLFFFAITGTLVYGFFLFVLAIGLKRVQPNPVRTDQPFVSVIIPARNEEKNIRTCLTYLTRQNYPQDRFEVIIIDDHSDDQTFHIANSFTTAHPNIKLYSLGPTDGISPKKAALHTGIAKSRGDIILTTDADCRAPATWLQTMVAHFDADTAAVASWLYVTEDNHLLSKLERLDSLGLSFIGAAAFGLKRPFVANGANFAYRRSVYNELNGFDGVAEYVSGDDDLFLQKICAAKKWRCVFAADPGGTIVTNPNESLRGFFEQRFRWASKNRIYPRSLVLFEIYIYFYYAALVFITAAFLSGFKAILLLPVALKFLLDAIFMAIGAKKLGKRINPFYLFAAEWLQLFYVLIVGVWGLWGTYTWKGRKYTKGKVR